MNLDLKIFLYIWIFIILLWVFIVIIPWIHYKRKISRVKNKYFIKKINETLKKRISLREKIITLDKILHNILLELWYYGTLWEILKKEPEYILNIEKIWELHKLRNKLVHNIDDDYSDNFLYVKLEEFNKELKILLKNI
jgi:hypothetical protein